MPVFRLSSVEPRFSSASDLVTEQSRKKVGRRAVCTAVTLFLELNQTVTSVFARNTVGQDREGMKFTTGVPMLKNSSRFVVICWSIG